MGVTMHVGAFGFNLVGSTDLDLTSTTAAQVIIRRPDGTVITKDLIAGAFTAVAPLWHFSVPIDTGDLTVDGTYLIQFIDTTPGRRLPCSVGKFNILPNA